MADHVRSAYMQSACAWSAGAHSDWVGVSYYNYFTACGHDRMSECASVHRP